MKLGSPEYWSICCDTVSGATGGAFESILLETSVRNGSLATTWFLGAGAIRTCCLGAGLLATCCLGEGLLATCCFEAGLVATCCRALGSEKAEAMRIPLEASIEKADADAKEYTFLTDMRPIFR